MRTETGFAPSVALAGMETRIGATSSETGSEALPLAATTTE